jgi:hypothetical protein
MRVMIAFRNIPTAADIGQQNFRATIKQGQLHCGIGLRAMAELFP